MATQQAVDQVLVAHNAALKVHRTDINTALNSANSATLKANTASADATSAKTTAATAQSAATAAQTAAQQAQTAASSAVQSITVGGQTYAAVNGVVDLGTIAGGSKSGVLAASGINLSGLEFGGTTAATVPGTLGTDYFAPNAGDYAYLYAQGVRTIRVPFLAERETTSARLAGIVQAATAAGLTVILDMHNYARRFSGGSQQVLGQGWAVSDWCSQWVTLASDPAIKGKANVHLDLMNEPHDLAAVAGSWSSASTITDFASSLGGWASEDSNATIALGSGVATLTLKAGQTIMRFNDSAGHSSVTFPNAANKTLRARIRCTNKGGASAVKAFVQVQDTSYAWSTSGTSVDISDGAWHDITVVPSDAIWASHKSFGVEVDANGATGATVCELDIVDIGNLSGALTAAQSWEQMTLQCVTALENAGITNKIAVESYNWASLPRVASEHPGGWWLAGHQQCYLEAHYYVDADNSGTYTQTYAAETTSISGTYSSISAKVTAEIADFKTWVDQQGSILPGVLIGEIGWPNGVDANSWNAIGSQAINAFNSYGWAWTYWATGSPWGTTYALSAYTGSPLSTAQSQATAVLNAKYSALAVGTTATTTGPQLTASETASGSGVFIIADSTGQTTATPVGDGIYTF